MAGQLAPVVQAQDDLVLGQGGVDAGQAALQLLVQLKYYEYFIVVIL